MRKQTVYAPRVLGQGLLQANLSLFEPAALDSIGNQTVVTGMLGFSGIVELMVMYLSMELKIIMNSM